MKLETDRRPQTVDCHCGELAVALEKVVKQLCGICEIHFPGIGENCTICEHVVTARELMANKTTGETADCRC